MDAITNDTITHVGRLFVQKKKKTRPESNTPHKHRRRFLLYFFFFGTKFRPFAMGTHKFIMRTEFMTRVLYYEHRQYGFGQVLFFFFLFGRVSYLLSRSRRFYERLWNFFLFFFFCKCFFFFFPQYYRCSNGEADQYFYIVFVYYVHGTHPTSLPIFFF